MQLEHLMTMRADLKPPINVGAGPSGVRQIFDVAGGTFEGPRLRGTIVPGGGDWFRIGADGVGRLDVRATLRTDDGAHIYVRYEGIFEFAKVVAKLGRGEETEFGEAYFMTTPRFETGDERYTWLNRVIAVGEGRSGPNRVEYRVYEAVNG